MNSTPTFLFAMGLYNLLGSLVLAAFLSNSIGDIILTRHFRIFRQPYQVGPAGFLWLVWAIVLNVFFSALNLLAFRWGEVAQHDVLALDIGLYICFVVLSVFALRSPNYSVGVWYNFPIFLFWIAWGLYLIC